MDINHVIGIQEVDREKQRINSREAVRAVIIKEDKVLMIHTNKGDYKFPGGGIKKEENHERTLVREVEEETGCIVDRVKDKIGVVVERNVDLFEKDAIFEMISYYYLCEVSNQQKQQQLDDYEAELDFSPEWITLQEAIEVNKKVLQKKVEDINPWVVRETFVLEEIFKFLMKE